MGVMSASMTQAATYYVSTSGSDGYNCQQAKSVTTPKATITGAAGGISCLASGDTLLIRAGNYDETIWQYSALPPSGASWAGVTRIAAYPGETVWLRPVTNRGNGVTIKFDTGQRYIEFDGINVSGVGQMYGPIGLESTHTADVHHIRIKNAEIVADPTRFMNAIQTVVVDPAFGQGGHEFIKLKIHGGAYPQLAGQPQPAEGIYIEASNVLVDGCEIYGMGAGLQIYNGYGRYPDAAIIRNNIIHDMPSTGSTDRHWGITVAAGSHNTRIYNNVIYGITQESTGSSEDIFLYASSGTLVYNNTLVGGTRTGAGIYVAGGTNSGSQIINNISVGHPGGTDIVNDAPSTTVAHNLVSPTDPLFVSGSARNFQLRSQSSAIDAGVTLPLVAVDILGAMRPQGGAYDIGAYENRATSAQPVATTSPDGRTVPPAANIVDNLGATWTIAPGGAILRNSGQAADGWGLKILWKNTTIYVQGTDNYWWRWSGSGWIGVGTIQP
jgi:hypothetical protein